jgi:biotin carboxyl carrier protein
MRATIVVCLGLMLVGASLIGAADAAPRQAVEVKATLRGEVLADGLAAVGDDVREGDPVVFVRTQTGRGVAARAPVDGRVVEVLVRPGTVIREFGMVVARLEPR